MSSLLAAEIATLVVLLVISALLTCAEAAYFSFGRARLKQLAEAQGEDEGPLTPLLRQTHELLVTLLVGITVVNIGASALAAAIAEKLLGASGLPIAIGVMIILLSVFGEVLPMTLAVEHPERFSAVANRPVAWLSALLAPVRLTLGGLTALTLRVAGSERRRGEPEISEQELRTLVDVGAREGVVDRTEREMIHGVFELEDTLVREVMVPRPDMFCLDVATPREDILPLLRDHLHSRVPVCDDTVDQVVGVLYTKDLLPHRGGLPDGFDLRAHLHPARIWCDLIEPKECQVLAVYPKDFYAGRPALTTPRRRGSVRACRGKQDERRTEGRSGGFQTGPESSTAPRSRPPFSPERACQGGRSPAQRTLDRVDRA